MRTIVFIILISTIIVATCFAWGDKWAGKNFGADNWGEAQWGSGGAATDTYWNTPMADRWNTPMTALWNTSMDTEIP